MLEEAWNQAVFEPWPCKNSLVRKSGRELISPFINYIWKSKLNKMACHLAKILKKYWWRTSDAFLLLGVFVYTICPSLDNNGCSVCGQHIHVISNIFKSSLLLVWIKMDALYCGHHIHVSLNICESSFLSFLFLVSALFKKFCPEALSFMSFLTIYFERVFDVFWFFLNSLLRKPEKVCPPLLDRF